jgi:RNA polymerase sigma-70 factor (ECF subfamily)
MVTTYERPGADPVSTGASYLQRIAAGENDAIEACMTNYAGLVSSLARRFLPPAQIDDAVQEVFIELWKNADRFDPEKASEPTFIAMIARRRLIDKVRKNARRPKHQPIETTYGLGQRAQEHLGDMDEELARATLAIRELSEPQKLVLRLSLRDGMSHQEIADATGMALGSVKTHLRRGMIRLRELVNEQGTQDDTESTDTDG